jgi:hypothetical protein
MWFRRCRPFAPRGVGWRVAHQGPMHMGCVDQSVHGHLYSSIFGSGTAISHICQSPPRSHSCCLGSIAVSARQTPALLYPGSARRCNSLYHPGLGHEGSRARPVAHRRGGTRALGRRQTRPRARGGALDRAQRRPRDTVVLRARLQWIRAVSSSRSAEQQQHQHRDGSPARAQRDPSGPAGARERCRGHQQRARAQPEPLRSRKAVQIAGKVLFRGKPVLRSSQARTSRVTRNQTRRCSTLQTVHAR